MSTIWTFDGIENNHDVYRGKDFMKKCCEYLGVHSMKVINFEKKKMIPLTKGQWEKTKICKKYLNITMLMIKVIVKLKTIVIMQVNTEVLHIAYVI